MTERGYCHYCHQPFDLVAATPEQAAAIAEDAQRPEDYFFMPDHVDEKTGRQCEGVDKSPESFIGQEEAWADDDFHVSGDDDTDGWPEAVDEPDDFVGPTDEELEEAAFLPPSRY